MLALEGPDVVPFIHVTVVFMLNMACNRMASATLKIVNISHFRQAGRLLSAIIHSAVCCCPFSMSFQSRKQNSKASDKLVPPVRKSPENDDFCQSGRLFPIQARLLGFPREITSAEKLRRETTRRNHAEKLRRETTFVEKLLS
jgi:hypothetical protein